MYEVRPWNWIVREAEKVKERRECGSTDGLFLEAIKVISLIDGYVQVWSRPDPLRDQLRNPTYRPDDTAFYLYNRWPI